MMGADRELEMAIELSRKTFIEEQAKRRDKEKKEEAITTPTTAAAMENQQQQLEDLMVIEDPAVIERNRQIEEIKQLLRETKNTHWSPPCPCPTSANANTNPFFPMAVNSPASFFGQPQIMAPPPSSSIYAPNQHHFWCLPSTSSTQFEYFPPPDPATPAFSISSIPSAQSFFTNGPQNNLDALQPNQQQFPLNIQTNLLQNPPFKQKTNLAASPLKTPFRHGDLIDLNSPRNARSMAIEEFDPLYKKLQNMIGNEEEELTAENANEIRNRNKDDQQEKRLTDVENGRLKEEGAEGKEQKQQRRNASTEEKPKAKPRKTIGSPSMAMATHRLLTCQDLKAKNGFECDFYKEKQLLSEMASRLASELRSSGKNDVFFLSPVLDYFVTSVETIKLRVHQDETWPKDIPEEPKRLEMACGVKNTSEEILMDVLLRLLSQEEIAENEGQIPLGEYSLKVFGTDEFLVRDAPIGKHPFVADFLAKGNDVELEVGKCRLPSTPMPNRMMKRTVSAYPIVNEDVFGTFFQTLNDHVTKCLANPEDRRHRQPVLQSIKMITTYMCNIQPEDLVSAIDFFQSANSFSSIQEAVNFIVVALLRLFRAYSRSTLTDFTVSNPLMEEQTPSTAFGEIRDASGCIEKLLLRVESAHNLPAAWSGMYKAFYLEAHLMYGPKSFGMCASSARTMATNSGNGNKQQSNSSSVHIGTSSSSNNPFACWLPIQIWVDFDNVHISSLPRECQICFILSGVPILDEQQNGANGNQTTATSAGEATAPSNGGGTSTMSSGYGSARNSANHESGIFARHLASASLPLYNVDGFLLQGPILVPLRSMEDDVVQPWGPRPLIRDPQDIILVVKALEFDYRIQFPEEIRPTEVHWRQFDTLAMEEQENLQILVERAISHQLADDDREFLWSNRNSLFGFPRALPLVLGSSFSWGTYSLGNIYALLHKWAPLPPMVAIELLLPYFQDKFVRQKALEWIGCGSSEFLFNLITQFVEALRYETFENSALAAFLLEQSTKDRRFAFELFWQLQHRIHQEDGATTKSPAFAARCHLLQQMLLELGIPSFENEIAFQLLFLERLDKIATSVKACADIGTMTKILHKELYQLSEEVDLANLRIPIAPSFRCTKIAVSECSVFNSLTKPIKIILKGKRKTFGIIYKAGDDLRQDAVVIQLVRAMNDIWLSEELDLRMVVFRCLPTGYKKGLIELVPNCSTLREIQIQTGSGVAGVYKDEVLANWLERQNPSEFQYKAAIENFRRSCAGWCVVTYVLGIGDRHNDNILITTNGHVFHIDFGKYMGDWQMAAGFKRDRVPFVFTPEMAFMINGGQSSTEHFQRFVDECCQALNLLRRNSGILLNIMRFLSCSDIPGMSMESVNFVENNLMLELNDVQATVLFTRMLEESMQSRFPRLNFFAHTIAQFKGNPLQISGVTKAEDMNRLSFISEIYTEKSEGRIESVLVSSYEKWQENSKKIYMYKLLVKRQLENVNTPLYRTFQEFQELHWKLCYRFSSRAIPTLSQTVNVGRTNIRAVAVRRQWELQYFLQRMFTLSDEVAHSDLMYTFLHPLYRDTEPETRKLNGMPDIRVDINSQCQLLLRISLDQPNSELRIFVGHAKNLPLVGREQPPDSYVKTYLRWGVAQHNKQWKRKTQVVKNAQNPTYNAEVSYSLANLCISLAPSFSQTELSHLSLDVSVWHSGNAVLKDNFPLCETRIQLNQLEENAATKKGIKELASWFTLTPSYDQ